MKLDSWDDLRVLLAVARAGSLTTGARALCVDQTTVTRRMKALEERQGIKIFHRMRGGVQLTQVGEAFVRAAMQLEERLLDLDLELSGSANELSGSVRLTLPHGFAYAWIEELADFARAHPSLQLELVVDDSFRSLTRREADVALRYARNPPDHLVGRKLGRVALAVYGAPELKGMPLEEVPWIGWEPGLVDSNTERFRRKYSPKGRYVLYANSMLVFRQAARKGRMAVLLSCLTGDAEPGLVRLTEPEVTEIPLWVLTHPDLQQSPRIRAVMDHVTEFVTAAEDRLLGR